MTKSNTFKIGSFRVTAAPKDKTWNRNSVLVGKTFYFYDFLFTVKGKTFLIAKFRNRYEAGVLKRVRMKHYNIGRYRPVLVLVERAETLRELKAKLSAKNWRPL